MNIDLTEKEREHITVALGMLACYCETGTTVLRNADLLRQGKKLPFATVEAQLHVQDLDALRLRFLALGL